MQNTWQDRWTGRLFPAVDHVVGSSFRYASLDGLRGFAALSVVFFHASWGNRLAMTQFVRNCYTSVDLFFLLSGFVIAASYRSRVATGAEVGVFLQRRFFRVYPLHAFGLAILVLMEVSKVIAQARGAHFDEPPFTETKSLPSLALNILFLQGTGLARQTTWNPPSWTVSSEFVAYTLFALAGLSGIIRHRAVVIAAAGAGLVAYATLAWAKGTLDLTYDLGVVRCLAGFSIGVALFDLRDAPPWSAIESGGRWRSTLLEGVVAVLLAAVLATAADWRIVFVIPCFAAVILLAQREKGALSRLLRSAPFQFLGVISYSIYLVHVPIRGVLIGVVRALGFPAEKSGTRVVLMMAPWQSDVLLAVFVVLAVAAACVTYLAIEDPARLYGARLLKRPRRNAVAKGA